MLSIGFLLAIVFQQPLVFQVTGEISGSARHDLRSAQIESIDRRFVAFGEIDPDGRFSFKNVPEGLCKIMIVTDLTNLLMRHFPEICDLNIRGQSCNDS